MTDVNQAAEAQVTGAEASPDEKPILVPITKGKGTLELFISRLPDNVYREILVQGAKVVANRGMTKITKETYPNAEELKAAAMAKATETLQAMYDGKIRIMGAKADKISGAVMTEARRLARNLVKDQLKAMKVKISYVEASEITKAANALIAANPDIVKQAEASLKEREAKAETIRETLKGFAATVPISEAKKAKAEAEKAKAKEQLSKTQAGKVLAAAPKQRPQANA